MAKSLPAPQAVLFDLDETLADRKAALVRYASVLADEFAAHLHPCCVDDIHAAIVAADDFGSYRQAETLCASLSWRERQQADVLFRHWQDRFGTVCTPFDDVEIVLSELRRRGINLGLITNGSAAMQRAKIAALGLETSMSVIAISGELGVSKPDSAIFNHALSVLECRPEHAWFVGDHPIADVQGARDAGLTAFWVKTGFPLGEGPQPERTLDRLADLLDYVKSCDGIHW